MSICLSVWHSSDFNQTLTSGWMIQADLKLPSNGLHALYKSINFGVTESEPKLFHLALQIFIQCSFAECRDDSCSARGKC